MHLMPATLAKTTSTLQMSVGSRNNGQMCRITVPTMSELHEDLHASVLPENGFAQKEIALPLQTPSEGISTISGCTNNRGINNVAACCACEKQSSRHTQITNLTKAKTQSGVRKCKKQKCSKSKATEKLDTKQQYMPGQRHKPWHEG